MENTNTSLIDQLKQLKSLENNTFPSSFEDEPKIENLTRDINRTLSTSTVVSSEDAASLGQQIASLVATRLAKQERPRTLRMSNLGTPCRRKLYYSVRPEYQGELPSASAHLKFLYGDILEALLLFLARVSGHRVEGEQTELEINGIKGHRDAVIDGVTVDCKSASSRSFQKFSAGLNSGTDAFGYLDQLGAYSYAGRSDNTVTDKSRHAFLAVDKQFGHIALDAHPTTDKDYGKLADDAKAMVASDTVPQRAYFDEPEGKSGNRKLGTACSYCEFKKTCWPGLRTFAYSTGPMFLTHVAKLPQVREIKDADPQADVD